MYQYNEQRFYELKFIQSTCFHIEWLLVTILGQIIYASSLFLIKEGLRIMHYGWTRVTSIQTTILYVHRMETFKLCGLWMWIHWATERQTCTSSLNETVCRGFTIAALWLPNSSTPSTHKRVKWLTCKIDSLNEKFIYSHHPLFTCALGWKIQCSL